MGIRKASGAAILALTATLAAYSGISATAGDATARTSLAVSPGAINWGKPVVTDNFSGTALSTSWSIYNDPDAKSPKPKRTPDSVRVQNGSLQLIGHYEKPYGYVGGGVAYRTNQTYGRWEIRFRADAGAGYAPVVLLWPKGRWPDDGEIDLAEVGNPQRHGAGEFLHLGASNRFIGKHIPSTVDFTKWHTIAVDWLPGHITFWLDGKALWTVKRAAGNADYVPSTPFHLALQNDAGCDVGCKTDKNTPPQVVMDVDWVKIYAVPGSAPATSPASIPSPSQA